MAPNRPSARFANLICTMRTVDAEIERLLEHEEGDDGMFLLEGLQIEQLIMKEAFFTEIQTSFRSFYDAKTVVIFANSKKHVRCLMDTVDKYVAEVKARRAAVKSIDRDGLLEVEATTLSTFGEYQDGIAMKVNTDASRIFPALIQLGQDDENHLLLKWLGLER